MNPLFETWKLAVLAGGSNRAIAAALEEAQTPPPDSRDLTRLKAMYKPMGKTRTGPIEPNVGVPEAG